MKTSLSLAALALGLVSFTAFGETDGKVYINCTTYQSATYTDSEGNPTTFKSGDDVVYTALPSGNSAVAPNYSTFNSITFAAARNNGFWTDNHWAKVGAGGIKFTTNTFFPTGRNAANAYGLTLSANQTWSGTDTELSPRAGLSIGWFYSDYYKMNLGVTADVTALTIEKYMDAWFLGQNATLGAVDVTVKAPARLYLVQTLSPAADKIAIDSRLAAKSLTLEGDGCALSLAAYNVLYGNQSSRVTTGAYLDAAHYAPTLNLAQGADLVASGETVFAIPNVTVSGSASDVSAVWARSS